MAAYDNQFDVVKPGNVYDHRRQPHGEHEKYIEVLYETGRLFKLDFKDFFHPSVIVYICIHPGPDDRHQAAIIKFSSICEKHEALKKDGSVIGVAPIKISVPTEKYCYDVESYIAAEYPPEGRRVWQSTPAHRDYCVEILGIPSATTYDLLGKFFDLPDYYKEVNMFMEFVDGICKGRAFIDFGSSVYEYNRALLRDRALLMEAPVTVRSIRRCKKQQKTGLVRKRSRFSSLIKTNKH